MDGVDEMSVSKTGLPRSASNYAGAGGYHVEGAGLHQCHAPARQRHDLGAAYGAIVGPVLWLNI